MKKLNRVPGYRDSEIKRFNKMYECLVERMADSDIEMKKSFYTSEELEAFRTYLILAEADEKKRREAMRYKRKLEDFTLEEVERFDHMQEVLEEFNRLVDDPEIDMMEIMPFYSDIEMAEHSQYSEIKLERRCRDSVDW